MNTLRQAQLNEAVSLLRDKLNPHFVILFGSAARGELGKDSDVDIAYHADVSLTAYDNFMLAQTLADKLKRDVDLVDLRRASTVFQAQIMGTGIVIDDRDPLMRMNFHMRAFKAYAKLNEERQCVLDKYDETGTRS